MNLSRTIQSRWVRVALDAVLIAAVFTGGYRLAYRYLSMSPTPTFIFWELKPAVMFACGYGFTQPGAPTPAVDEFIYRKRDSISCQEFAWGGAPTEPIGIAYANRYSLYGAGWAMRLRGVRWDTLDAYLAFLFGLSMALTYGLYRMAAGRVLAIAGVIAVGCSAALMEIVVLRDFIKLPCFTALWLVLAWVVRDGLRRGAGATIIPMIVGGALLGLGIGLRMDALVFLPMFVAVVLFAVPGFHWKKLLLKAASAAAFVVTFFIAGGPILNSISSGSNSAHVVVLGLMTPFDRGLAIDPAPYDVGAQYSDGYAYTVIVSDALLAQGEKLPIILGSAEYDRVGGSLLRRLAFTFPGDVVTRAMGATWQIFRYPADWRIRDQAEKMPLYQESAWLKRVMAWRTWVLGPFAERELVLTLFVLVLASAFNRRLGVLGLAFILYFCGYSMLQFSRRHMFHLDAIPIFVMLLAVQLPIALAWRIGSRFRESREAGRAALRASGREMAIGTAALAVALALFMGVWTGLRWYQDGRVAELVRGRLAANWVAAPATEEPLADSMLIDGRPSASWYEVFMRNQESWTSATLLRLDGVVPRGAELEHTPDLRQQYFKVTLDGRCQANEVMLGLKYTGAGQTFDYEFTRAFTVPVAQGRPSYVLTPAYYHLGGSWNRFDGFAVPAVQRACVVTIERAADPKALTLPVVSFVVAPDWQDARRHQQLLDRPLVSAAGTPVDPLPTDEGAYRSGWRRRNNAPLAQGAPPLDQWTAIEGVSVAKSGDRFTVTTNRVPSGYQVMSPPLDVPARRKVSFQVVGEIEEGEICIGVLDGAQQRWLLAPTNARTGLLVDTREHQQVRFVFSNCAHPPGRFSVRAITYEPIPQP